MRILIKKLDGKKAPMNVDNTESISKIKDKLAEKTGIFTEAIRLIFRGRPLDGTKTIQELSINDGDVLHMILQLRGGY